MNHPLTVADRIAVKDCHFVNASTVYSLDGRGARGKGVAAGKAPTGFRIRLDSETPWYEVASK